MSGFDLAPTLAAASLGMGGYGGYVWPAFAIAALVLGGLLAQSLISARRNEAEAAALRAERTAAAEPPIETPAESLAESLAESHEADDGA
ncbi:MAG: heme exporter protein CcmD [Rhodospirillaceae bacterium]|jgi:heme exporter protein D|nr:heme exporter protein CcmD [Rhodospirillaceae bacterium]MBT6116795.1 heme exporter protein CcmD [Rhodospirillaceae bacterium]